MNKIFLLTHSYEKECHCEETKILGMFLSYQDAEKAIEKYKILPGFKDKQEDFYIDRYDKEMQMNKIGLIYNNLAEKCQRLLYTNQ